MARGKASDTRQGGLGIGRVGEMCKMKRLCM
jgi:hypothetical protein